MIAGALISILQIKDQRSNLGFYGHFFDDIPKRLGFNRALDASVKALTTAFPFHHTRVLPSGTLNHYVDALRATRNTLNDSVEAKPSNTLCAMYLILVCSVSMAPKGPLLLAADVITVGVDRKDK